MPSDLERALSALLKPRRNRLGKGANIVSAGIPDTVSSIALHGAESVSATIDATAQDGIPLGLAEL